MISKDQKKSITCTKGECGETFYSRYTAQHQLQYCKHDMKDAEGHRYQETGSYFLQSQYCTVYNTFVETIPLLNDRFKSMNGTSISEKYIYIL